MTHKVLKLLRSLVSVIYVCNYENDFNEVHWHSIRTTLLVPFTHLYDLPQINFGDNQEGMYIYLYVCQFRFDSSQVK